MHTLYYKLYNENDHWPENMSIWLLVLAEVNQTPDQLPLHKVMCIWYTAHCTLHTGHCTMHTVYFTLHISHYTLYTLHCTLFCTLNTSHCAPQSPHHSRYNLYRKISNTKSWYFYGYFKLNYSIVPSTVLRHSLLSIF